jgi:hypothetical protein
LRLAAIGRFRYDSSVHKRIVIGALACVGIALLVFVFSAPREGTIEWHKQGYRTVIDRFEGRTFSDRCRRVLGRVTGRAAWQIDAAEGHALAEKLDEHRAALIDLGYLVEHRFATTNDARSLALSLYVQEQLLPRENRIYAWRAGSESNAFTVIGRPEDLPKWEEMIRNVDATSSSNSVKIGK